MARNKNKDFCANKKEKTNCNITENCNASDITDSVEFADEPFNSTCKKNKAEKNNQCDQ